MKEVSQFELIGHTLMGVNIVWSGSDRYEIFTRYDKQLDMISSFQVIVLILSREVGRIPLLSLNLPGEKSQATKILGKFVNKP